MCDRVIPPDAGAITAALAAVSGDEPGRAIVAPPTLLLPALPIAGAVAGALPRVRCRACARRRELEDAITQAFAAAFRGMCSTVEARREASEREDICWAEVERLLDLLDGAPACHLPG